MRVLVVEDSGVTRKVILLELSEIGIHRVDEAGDGVTGWRMFRNMEYDLVITDWNMPNMNGLDLLESIRATGSTVPVLMITTESEKEKVIEAVKSGVTDYLLKPFESDHLQDKISLYCNAPA